MSIGFLAPLSEPAEVPVVVRFNVDYQGQRYPLTAQTTESDIATLAEQCGGDRAKAMQIIAEAAWQQYYEPRMRKQT